MVRQPCLDAPRGDTRGRQYRVAVPSVVVADPEQHVLCADAVAAEGAGLVPRRANTAASVLAESFQHGRPKLRLGHPRDMPHT